MILFHTMPLFWVGVSLFSYFIYTAPEPCPEKYMKTVNKGGVLENAGDVYRYCTYDKRDGLLIWTLKDDVRVTFDDVLKEEKK